MFAFILAALRASALEIFVPQKIMLPPGGAAVVPPSWNQQAEKEAALLVGLIDPDY